MSASHKRYPYFVYCAHDTVNELISAECKALTGGDLQPDGFALCASLDDIRRSAYIHWGAKLIAYGATVEALVADAASQNLQFDDFSTKVFPMKGAGEISTTSLLEIVCDKVEGNVNLKNPKHRLAIMIRHDGFYFGEIVAEPDMGWQAHEAKPFKTSGSLPARMSRALVNLVCKPGDTLLNPCVGTGSLMIEAESIGAYAIGIDIRWNMVNMSRKNLEHFGFRPKVSNADASTWQQRGDCLIADLPYDRNCKITDENLQKILANAFTLAPKSLLIAAHDLSDVLKELGANCQTVYCIYKSSGFQRYIHYIETE